MRDIRGNEHSEPGTGDGGQFRIQSAKEPILARPLTGENTSEKPSIWSLEVIYNDGFVETISVTETGSLRSPHRSDRLTLSKLLGFKQNRSSEGPDVTVSEAFAEPETVAGFHPIFDTTEGFPTTVLGQVAELRKAGS
jgi:hypothetical protein